MAPVTHRVVPQPFPALLHWNYYAEITGEWYIGESPVLLVTKVQSAVWTQYNKHTELLCS